MTRITTYLLFVTICSSMAYAAPQDEINHLLQYVKNTSCSYERNGKRHTGEEALKHIKKKYDYFSDEIETAEDFIKYSATKSKMSGKYYKVYCNNNKPVLSKSWLLTELKQYRKNTEKS